MKPAEFRFRQHSQEYQNGYNAACSGLDTTESSRAEFKRGWEAATDALADDRFTYIQ